MRALAFVFCLACFVFGCQSPGRKKEEEAKAVLLPNSLEPFADSLVRLDKYAMESIDDAARFYTQLVPADSALADSAAVLLLRHLWSVTDTVNQKLYADTTDYSELVYNPNAPAPEKQKAFQRKLAAHHLVLQGDGEGGVYAAPDYDWAVPLLRQKTSPAVDEYLLLLSKEETSPALLDAGLAIEMNELVDRLLTAERLSSKPLPQRFAEDARQKNAFYTSVLILGTDNTPAMEFDKLELTEEFRNGYAHLHKRAPASKAAQTVREWQSIVNAKNQKKVDAWRTKYALY